MNVPLNIDLELQLDAVVHTILNDNYYVMVNYTVFLNYTSFVLSYSQIINYIGIVTLLIFKLSMIRSRNFS